MVLRIDPDLSVVWRSPHCVQLGAERPVAVLALTGPGEERLLAALRIGTTRSALEVLAAELPGPPPDVGSLLARLGPALTSAAVQSSPQAVVVELFGKEGAVADAAAFLATALRDAGFPAGQPADATGPACGADRPSALGVLTAAHVVPPAAAARWLSLDRPHLPVVFGDVSVEIGPLVLAGATACLHCVERHRMARAPFRHAIAAQLLAGTHPAAAASRPALVLQAASLVVRAAEAVRDGDPTAFAGRSLRVQPDGSVRRALWRPHPGCSCRALSGTATAPGGRHGAVPPRPRTAAASTAPA
ncbi:MAG: hypothetical protein JWR33_1572 [Naasia sp.]|nr:hypothetical protein [Naasia sp.]